MLAPFNDADSVISSTAFDIANNLMGGAYVLGGILASGYFLWATLRYIADSQENYMSLVMDALIPVAIGAAVLKNYTSVITGVQNIFKSMLVGSLSNGLTGQIAQLFANFMSGLANGFLGELNAIACADFTSSLAVYFNSFINLLCLLVAAFLAVFALAELVGVLLTGSVLMGVGISVGPYFVVSGVTPWSKGFMDKWLSFSMGAFFYKTLITIVLALMNGVMSSVITQLASYNGTTGLPLGTVIALVGLMWVMRHIFMGIPGIAAALVGGHRIGPPSLNREAGNVARDISNYMEKKERQEERRQQQAEREERRADRQREAESRGNGGGTGPTVSSQRGSFNPGAGPSGAPALSGRGGSGGSSGSSGSGSSSGTGPSGGGGPSGGPASGPRFRPEADVQDVRFKETPDDGSSGSGGRTSTSTGMPRGGGSGSFQV
ncbi:type IV secretion system protein [Burkholderia sp. Ac-20365]|uniref:type IV secretion system protein n=1 Tax=Burkholderia sp. Ac-20365 TaxID=2703897 RepID=UPI00197B2BF3|nr:type IV secretion system protein [Burkholderia sp. Ac-20365]MBN3761059.1 type IV secretion system protein [Burkholderia sp. Ac-20365]